MLSYNTCLESDAVLHRRTVKKGLCRQEYKVKDGVYRVRLLNRSERLVSPDRAAALSTKKQERRRRGYCESFLSYGSTTSGDL